MPSIIIVDINGIASEVDAPVGKTILNIAQSHDFDVEGACEGSLACSTCHIIIDPDWVNKLAPAKEEECDMLDLAYGLTRTSRLGCQVLMSKELDGMIISLPSQTHNLMI